MTEWLRAAGRRLRAWVFPLAALAAFEGYARTAGAGSDALAPPSAAVRALARAMVDGSLWEPTAFTLGAAALGLAMAAVLGISLGMALGLSQRAAQMGFFTIEVLRPVPSVALIPLAMLVFGFGLRMEFSIVAFAAFWPMLILTQAAVHDTRSPEVASKWCNRPGSASNATGSPAACGRKLAARVASRVGR